MRLGPDLSKLGREATDAYLIESVLQPSKVIKKGYETVTIATDDGKDVDRPAGRGATRRVVLRDPAQDGKLVTIVKQNHRPADRRRAVAHAGRAGQRACLAAAVPRPDPLPPRDRRRRSRARAALAPDPAQVAGLKLPDYERRSTTPA